MVKLLPDAERDPLTHMEQYLTAKKLFTTRWKNQLVHSSSRENLTPLSKKREGLTYPLSSRFTACCKRLTGSLGFVSLNTGERFCGSAWYRFRHQPLLVFEV